MKVNYGMENVRIEETTVSGHKTYLVYADTERFGRNEIMYQAPNLEEAEKWLKESGVKLKDVCYRTEKIVQEVKRMIEAQMTGHGKIQIGSWMYHRPYYQGKSIYAYSNKWGWECIDRYLENLTVGKNGYTTTYRMWSGGLKKNTVKFGKDCTW